MTQERRKKLRLISKEAYKYRCELDLPDYNYREGTQLTKAVKNVNLERNMGTMGRKTIVCTISFTTWVG